MKSLSELKEIADFDFSKLTFGVEIECYNFTRNSLIEKGEERGLQVHSEDYNHEDNSHYFKIVSERSLTDRNSQEVVSPILKGRKGMNSLKAVCDALAEVDAKVNRSCGLHVHIGAASMSDAHYCRLVRNYQKLELAIDSFMPMSRRADNNRFCMSLQDRDFSNCQTKGDIAEKMNYDRYYKVNADAYARHKTIEFRQHGGTTEYEKISRWVMFLAKLVEFSYEKELETSVANIEDIPFLKDSEKKYFINRRYSYDSEHHLEDIMPSQRHKCVLNKICVNITTNVKNLWFLFRRIGVNRLISVSADKRTF